MGILATGAAAIMATAAPLNLDVDGHRAHILPTVRTALPKSAAGTGPLVYHGGPIMRRQQLYAIFWMPATLQTGAPTDMSASYQNLQAQLLTDYTANGIDNNNTQYYSTSGSTSTYVQNANGVGQLNNPAGVFVDTAPYPASGCNDTATPGNCITDAQIRTEIQRVMSLAGWTSGPNKAFLLYTSRGEGSCFTNVSNSCSYTQYCAYHGVLGFGGNPPSMIYANMPYANLGACQIAGTPSPNGNPEADAVANVASHEISEMVTDPTLQAWYDSGGNEIGDICRFNYGTNAWDSGQANQSWNGHFYELQQEFDNHTGTCVQVGP